MQVQAIDTHRLVRRCLARARSFLWPALALSILLTVVPFGSQGAPAAPSAPLAAPSAAPVQPIPPGQPNPGQVKGPGGQALGGDANQQQADGQGRRGDDSYQWLRFWAYLCVIIGGAFGGLIYGLSRNRGAVIPHFLRLQEGVNNASFNKLDLGFIGDMLIGIGGGIIVFNLVPQADSDIFVSLFNNAENFGKLASLLMKIAALSLIGGFAGISLFDEAAKRISRELEEVRSQAEANSGLINQLQSVGDLEAEIQYLLNPLVDPSFPPLNESDKDRFKKLLLKAPLNLRNKVFERLQNSYNAHLMTGVNGAQLSQSEIKIRLNLQECLTAGFDSLIAAADDQEQGNRGQDVNKHRYIAHKGFIHNQLAIGNEFLGFPAGRHWQQGEEDLTQAIQLRDQNPQDRENYWFYNLDRMLCRFKLGKNDEVSAELNSEMVQKWVNKQPGVVHKSLDLLPEKFYEFLKEQSQGKPYWNELFTRPVDAQSVSPQSAGPAPSLPVSSISSIQSPLFSSQAQAANGNGVIGPAPATSVSTVSTVAPTSVVSTVAETPAAAPPPTPPPAPVSGGPSTDPMVALQRIRHGGSL